MTESTSSSDGDKEAKKYWESQKKEYIEEKYFPHIIKSAATRLVIDEYTTKIKTDVNKEFELLKEAFVNKIGAKNIDPYDVFLLQYILSDDKEKLTTLAHLLIHRNTKKERIQIHNLMKFNEFKYDKRGDK
eukprot:Tbor_TRINITY_DN5871_c1_g1::TRINITY_DN5871_c1_g1_i2::g.7115::m.7115